MLVSKATHRLTLHGDRETWGVILKAMYKKIFFFLRKDDDDDDAVAVIDTE